MEREMRPGGPLSDTGLAQERVGQTMSPDWRRVVSFTGPDGKKYQLATDEELVHIQKPDGSGRETSIRTEQGDTPVEDWIRLKETEQTDKKEKKGWRRFLK